jgi:hypothetical protein
VSLQPFLLATFCDDVRQELGNKLSYLGIYGPNLVVPSFPTTLVKLCCVFTLRIPIGSIPKSIVFKLFRDEEVIFEADLSPADKADLLAGISADNAGPHALTVTSIAQLIGFQIPQRARLKTVAIVDGKELRGGALDLQAASTPAQH